MTTRREFLKSSGLAAAALSVGGCRSGASAGAGAPAATPAPVTPVTTPASPPAADASARMLLMEALDAAKLAGASYADARIGRYRNGFVATREKQIVQVADTESIGCGVRVLVDGTWGFAATRALTKAGVAGAAREAVAIARANRVARDRAVVLAPTQGYGDVRWQSAYTIDPFEVPVEQKADLLLRANAAALGVPGVKFVNTTLFVVKEDRSFASTDGTVTNQVIVRTWLPMTITAVAPDFSDFQSRANMVQPMARGWEYILEQDLVGNAPKWGEEAVQKLTAKPVDVGRYDLVLDPAHLWLTIHESIGHPTELDRAMGYEANYAGTSFVAPPEKQLGTLRYGPEFLNVQGDRNQEGGLATIGWDDEGVKPEPFLILRNGVLDDYQTTREQAPWLSWWYEKQGRPVKSHGCSNADSWSSVQFQRMPNVSILPGERDLSLDDLVAATDRGILITGDGSFSIDQQRYNAQFGGQLFHEIKGGKITGMLKDVAYQIRTPDFWNSLDMIGGKASYRLGGSFFDGKGQPGQVNAVSHGTPPCRFRQVNVINTGRKA
jgi:TldD protein